MIQRVLHALGWVPRAEREGAEIDYANARSFEQIRDPERLLAAIIDWVPNGSVWAIEGGLRTGVLEVLQPYQVDDGIKVMRGTVWPRPRYLKVLLDEVSKRAILASLENWDLTLDCIHQHIYDRDTIYMASFDNLDASCTWLSPQIPQGLIDSLVNQGCVELTLDD